jgi:hypothetical protein
MLSPTASDVRVFVPAKDLSISKAFYKALGWKLNGRTQSLPRWRSPMAIFIAELLQKEWANNFMIHVWINDAQAWYELASSIVRTGQYLDAKASPPAPQAYGALVTHVWDPSGVLLHLAQSNQG